MLVDKVAHRTLIILLVKFGISLVRSLWSGEIWDIQRKPCLSAACLVTLPFLTVGLQVWCTGHAPAR
jgi:hypothetical protein